jgi:hypothetical protein
MGWFFAMFLVMSNFIFYFQRVQTEKAYAELETSYIKSIDMVLELSEINKTQTIAHKSRKNKIWKCRVQNNIYVRSLRKTKNPNYKKHLTKLNAARLKHRTKIKNSVLKLTHGRKL